MRVEHITAGMLVRPKDRRDVTFMIVYGGGAVEKDFLVVCLDIGTITSTHKSKEGLCKHLNAQDFEQVSRW